MKRLLISSFALLLTVCSFQFAYAQLKATTSIQNTKWKLTYLPGVPDSLFNLTQEVYIQFDNTNKASGYAGCNNFFADYVINNDTLKFTQVGSTKKYCMKGMKVENSLLEALNNTHYCKINNHQLSLMQDDQVLAKFDEENGE